MCASRAIDPLWQTGRIVSRAPVLETIITLAALAGRTRRLKFGMNVIPPAFRDPVLVAKHAPQSTYSPAAASCRFRYRQPALAGVKALGIHTATRRRLTDDAR
jgi:hypothetical protein